MATFTLWCRKKVEVNTDPQRRCYDGCHFSSEMQWTAWGWVLERSDRQSLEETMATFQKINPTWGYKITAREKDHA